MYLIFLFLSAFIDNIYCFYNNYEIIKYVYLIYKTMVKLLIVVFIFVK